MQNVENTLNPVAVNLRQAAEISTLSASFLRLEIERGKLPVKRPGNSRRIVIMMSDFMEYLNGGKQNEK